MSGKASQYRKKRELLRLQRIRDLGEIHELGGRNVASSSAGLMSIQAENNNQQHHTSMLQLVQAESQNTGTNHNQHSQENLCSSSSEPIGIASTNTSMSVQHTSLLHIETSDNMDEEERSDVVVIQEPNSIAEDANQAEDDDSNASLIQERPGEFALSIARIATKHKLSDVCIKDIINLLNCCTVPIDGPQIKNLKQLDVALGLNQFKVKVVTTCTVCDKLEEEYLLNNPFARKCCEVSKSHNDPHYIVFDLEQILQIHLPCIQKYMYRNDLKYPYFENLKSSVNFTKDDITITLNTDGAPLFSSSNTSLWPVLAYVDGTSTRSKRSNVLILGLYVARKGSKPDFKTLLQPIVDQMNKLSQRPLKWASENGQSIKSRVFLSNVCCDSIARPPVQGLMQFNARFGCGYCLHDQTNHYFSHRIIERKRSSSCHRKIVSEGVQEARESQGIIAESAFLSLPYFNIIEGFPPDVMHTVYLGVTKMFTIKWLTEVSKPYSLSERQKNEIDKYLLAIRPPKRVSRTPRPMKYHSLYKAHEWSVWLFYYSPLIMQSVLPHIYFSHWHLLVRGISLLVGRTVSETQINESENCLIDFSSKVEELYGFNSCRFNVHLLLHLPSFVRSHGPLQNYSMYSFENFNMKLVNFVTGSQGVGSQISKRFLKDLVLKYHEHFSCPTPTTRKSWISVGPYYVANACPNSLVTDLEKGFLMSKNLNVDEVGIYGRADIMGCLIHSNFYKKVRLRNNCCVVITPTEVLEINYFLIFRNELYAYGVLHTTTHAPCNIDYIHVSLNQKPYLLKANELNMIVLKIEFRNTVYFLDFLNESEWMHD